MATHLQALRAEIARATRAHRARPGDRDAARILSRCRDEYETARIEAQITAATLSPDGARRIALAALGAARALDVTNGEYRAAA